MLTQLKNKCAICGATVAVGDWFAYESHRKRCRPAAVKQSAVANLEARMAGFIVGALEPKLEYGLAKQYVIDELSHAKLMECFDIVIREIDGLIGPQEPQVKDKMELLPF